ncbi:HIT family protein [Nonomuraea ferruginea]|uniref:HIT domain-containing protein n=1 Tax=Nonomuraea ferruginea TaxID=46174 RepID=A0ABT4SS44_9ACTN|nr:HIT domain-containing protein [Nonomuraea ferruginea]MDA0639725.1 HIT domain-containing protein [Nonomuraea ferruginea]
MTANACVFCRIIAGDELSQTIHEDDNAIAFLDIAQVTKGHSLVVPRKHHTDLSEISPDEAAQVMRTAVHVSRRLTQALGAPGINLWHASGETAWQSVFHFHIHVVPRYTLTDLAPPWTETESPLESLAGLAEEIRSWCDLP